MKTLSLREFLCRYAVLLSSLVSYIWNIFLRKKVCHFLLNINICITEYFEENLDISRNRHIVISLEIPEYLFLKRGIWLVFFSKEVPFFRNYQLVSARVLTEYHRHVSQKAQIHRNKVKCVSEIICNRKNPLTF